MSVSSYGGRLIIQSFINYILPVREAGGGGSSEEATSQDNIVVETGTLENLIPLTSVVWWAKTYFLRSYV